MKLTNNEQWILDYLKVDILPRLKRVGFLCASAGRRIRYGLTPAPQFGDAPPKYILSSRLPSLWTRSYFCESVGCISADTIIRYIENQKKH